MEAWQVASAKALKMERYEKIYLSGSKASQQRFWTG